MEYVTNSEAPKECRLIGEVEAGGGVVWPSSQPYTLAQLKTIMRNQTAGKGGNFLVIDALTMSGSGEEARSDGTGRAYNCPVKRIDVTSPPPSE